MSALRLCLSLLIFFGLVGFSEKVAAQSRTPLCPDKTKLVECLELNLQFVGSALAKMNDLNNRVKLLEENKAALEQKIAESISIPALRKRIYVKKPDEKKDRMVCSAYADWATLHPGPNQDPWPHSIVSIECEPGEIRLSGGCDMACFNIEHIISIPTDDDRGWQCGVKSTDKNRTFAAYAICLRP